MKAMLVDDHELFREGLALLMEQRFPDVDLRAVAGIQEALQALAREPDIELALLDLGLRDSHGLGSLQRLREAAPELSVVVMSADERPEVILAAIDQGAAGFIPKTARGGAIESALRVVLEGGVFLPSTVYRSIAPLPTAGGAGRAPMPSQEALAMSLGLSPRQIDVLRLLVQGRSTKLISRELDLAESTVKTHLIGLFRKLDVNSRTQAIIAAARLGVTFDV
ncbi:MAG: LuxR C-terminal-related transcriptional regulator [Leptothrix sp. (in: b-proteobacteria)]